MVRIRGLFTSQTSPLIEEFDSDLYLSVTQDLLNSGL